MHIESIEVGNYKCFWKPQKLLLEHGFNLFVGANNSGKTTILEALDLNAAANEPHRSVRNISEFGGRATGNSRFVVRIAANIPELRRLVGDQFYVPLPQNYAPPAGQEELVAQQIITSAGIVLEVGFEAGVDSLTYETVLGKSGIASRSGRGENNITALSLQFSDSKTPRTQIANFGNIASQVTQYLEQYRRVIYRFSAQRRPGWECANTGEPILDRDAANLPYCINHLLSNEPHGHKMLCEWVNRIFPSVQQVLAPPMPNNVFQLRCLSTPPEAQRSDLFIPIARMGTGIGNVIAMLYVVLTSRHPQVIAIDEPNSFLHPRALRELLQILATEGKQHQYILTAHSPDVLTAVKPNLITLFEFDGASTTIQ